MKERRIGETFAHYKLGTLRVVEESGDYACQGCVFDTPQKCTNDMEKRATGNCSAEDRSDNKGVIFVRVK